MKDQDKTKAQLINELAEMRQRGAQLQAADIEHKRAEEALRESEEKYRTILENIEDSYFEVDIVGNFTFFNDSLCRLLGYSEDELMGMNNRQYMDDVNAKALYRTFNAVYRTGKPAEAFDWEIIRKDGTTRFVESSVSLLRDSTGEPAGFRGIVHDATDRKRVEREIEERRMYLEGVLRAAPDAIVTLDAHHRIIEWNSGTERLFGYSQKEAAGRNIDDLVTGSDVLEEAVEFTQVAMDRMEVPPTETIRYRKDGSSVDVLVAGSPIMVGDEFIGVVAVYTDITARKRAEREIEERRMYIEGVLGAAPDAIVTLDAHHRIVEWNAGAEKLFGYSPEEVISQHLDRLITNPDVFEEATRFTQEALGGKALPPTETVRYRKDGSPVDVLLAGSPILVGDELIGAVAVYTDITQRKRMEETLRALALLDELTGLYNRRGFSILAEQQLKMAHRGKRRMVLLFADLDGLKQINDTFGHPEGDRALIAVADVLRETFRESDVIARIGGDEFVVLAIETNGFPAEILATRLRENLAARNAEGDRRYELSLSVGLARYDPKRPRSIDELLAQADSAMYEQKGRSK